jgi:hypothetical protein
VVEKYVNHDAQNRFLVLESSIYNGFQRLLFAVICLWAVVYEPRPAQLLKANNSAIMFNEIDKLST